MTLDIYAGLFDGDLDAVAERLDEAAIRDADSARTGIPNELTRQQKEGCDLRVRRRARRCPGSGHRKPMSQDIGNRCVGSSET